MKESRDTDPNVTYDQDVVAGQLRNASHLVPTRRTVLRAAGASIVLPALESLLSPSEARAQAQDQPLRMVVWHIGCGVWAPSWYPTSAGTDYALTPSLMPLDPVRKKVLVLSGIQNNPACAVTGSHGCGPPAMTTCRQGTKPNVQMGISVDQVYAQWLVAMKKYNQIPSLQLAIIDKTISDVGYPAVYNGTLSWAGDTQPLPPLVKPDLVFDKIFAGVTDAPPSGDAAAALNKRKALRQSVIDHVRGEANSLQPRLGKSDRLKLDQYLTSVREVERSVQDASMPSTATCSKSGVTKPAAMMYDIPKLTGIMIDLMVMAFRCDRTRVISFAQGNGGYTSFPSGCPWLNIKESHHDLSHHMNNAATGAKLAAIDKWEVEQYSSFLQKLDAIPEGNGTMLDNSVVFLSSEISDGNRHNQTNKPILIGGSAGGKLLTGRHLNLTGSPAQPDLFIALLNMFGVPATTFGTAGTKALAGVSV